MTVLWLDYESRSECDLPKNGGYNYARHPTTKMLCAAYAFDDEEVQLWWHHEPVPQRIAEYFASGGQIRCHNSAFDRLLTWYVVCPDYGLPEPELDRWYCTAAQARANCLPGSLEDVGRAVSSSMKKDRRGAELIRKICIHPFDDDPVLMQEFGEYAKQDVRAMRAISQSLRELSEQELADYHVNERINDRGLFIDTALCKAAMAYSAEEVAEVQSVFTEITGVKSVRSPLATKWVADRVGPDALKLMTIYKGGEKRLSFDANIRANLLTLAEEQPDQIPPDVEEVIKCASDIWASSTAKFGRMANIADVEDNRVRGAFIFAGGSATGRYSSYGIQLHNLPRKCAEDPEALRTAMVRGHSLVPKYGKRVNDVLKSMLRPAITVEDGDSLISLDWSGIEARVTPWVTGDERAEASLDVFREGRDVYVSTAALMFNKKESEVTKADRALGKVAVLACGFGGGVGAFANMGKVYGVVLPESEAKRMVQLWRKANPWARPFWSKIEDAFMCAMRNPGHEFSAGKVTYLRQGPHMYYALPSGRVLCYPFVKFEQDGSVSYLKAAFKPEANAKEWPRARLWFGILVENLVQATANCLLRHALRTMDAEGINVIGSIHDEILVQCKKDVAESVKQRMIEIMTCAPDWGRGLPLAVEGNIMQRFSK